MNRIIAMSDWHGLAARARKLVDQVNWNQETDELVVLGDMIDRGEDSIGCIELAMDLERKGAVILKGNHEDMAVKAFDQVFSRKSEPQWTGEDLALHLENGGKKFWDQVTAKKPNLLYMIRWFEHLRTSYVNSSGYVFVHASWDTRPSTLQDIEHNLWQRDILAMPRPADYAVVFGHTPTKYLRHDNRNLIFKDSDHPAEVRRIGIDCGGVFGGLLAAISLPDMKEYYV